MSARGTDASGGGKAAVRSINLDAAPWIRREGARLKEFAAHGKRLRLVEFLSGFSDPNWCLKGHVVFVIEGTLESEYADGVSRREAGQAFIVPPGVKHRSRNPGAAPARLLIVDDTV